MEFMILGPLEVSDDGRKLALGGPKQRAVLAHLILRANQVVQADLLIDGLWGEEPPESARNTLQTYVYRLRKVLGDGRLEGRDGGYVLAAAPGEIDAERFEALVKQGKAQVTSDPAAAAATLSDALSLWRSDALADVTEEPSLRGEAARLEELRLSATEHRVAAEIAMGGHSTVVPELESLTARYPLRERLWANLMLALYRSGRQAEALSTFERARQVLADELGADPSPELQRLHEQILSQDPALGAGETSRSPDRRSRIDMPPGTEFAGYRIERVLGRGGMSVVYLAEHTKLERKVALKVLASQLAEDERFRERFVRESRLAASIDHPNVIPIYEADEADGELFIAMRYVQGTDLRTRLQDGPLDPHRALGIVLQIAAALDAAHEQGLVHRDVKPANVLLAHGKVPQAIEHVYLSDFGLTKRSASDSGVTSTGQFVGTLDYAAPEQFQGGPPDRRTDVYSLGCVLFESLSGRPPFQAESDAGLMFAHLQREPPKLSTSGSMLPPEIDAVVATAMAKTPDARQQSAGELGEAAARALRSTTGDPSDTTSRPSSGWTRWRAPIGALVAALITGIVIFSISRGDIPKGEGTSGSPVRGAAASPTPASNFRTVERGLSENEERLLTYIPEDLGSDCLPLDRDEPLRGELAALVCRSADVEVLYELFPSRDAMNDTFQVNANNTQAPDGECATDHLAVTPYSIGGEPAGLVLCYTRSLNATQLISEGPQTQTSHIEWTDEDSAIYAHAIRNDLGDLTLYEWWVSSAGPVFSGAGGPVPAKDRPAAIAGPRLRDGSYLAAPPGGCSGFPSETTCRMRLEGETYEIVFVGDDAPSETGSISLRKEHAVVFAPRTGICFGEGSSARPAVYEWAASGDSLTLDRTAGGRCAGPQKLTHDPWTRAPGGLIAFATGSAPYEIALMNGAGFGLEPLTDGTPTTNISPDWSPDGNRIVFSGAAQDYDLYVMDADGGGLTRLTDQTGDEVQPVWSPDGKRIAFSYDDLGQTEFRSGVVIVDADGTAWTELMMMENASVYAPAWSPDGDRIAFSAFNEEGHELFVMDADGSDLAKIHEEPRDVLRAPMSWTPDGRRIVFWGEDSGRETLLSMRPDGTDVREFAGELPEGDNAPVLDWSPDGRWIVMGGLEETRFRTGSDPVVYLLRSDGSELFTIVAHGTEPTWRPQEAD